MRQDCIHKTHRAEAATENAPGMREHSALVIPAEARPERKSKDAGIAFLSQIFNFGHFYVKNMP